MKVSDFNYHLPDELVARYPAALRSGSRLLCLAGNGPGKADIVHRQFADITCLLAPGDLLVFNNTRVVPARMYGLKSSGGKVEILLEKLLGDDEFLAHIRVSRMPRCGDRILLEDAMEVEVLGREQEFVHFRWVRGNASGSLLEQFEHLGRIPLPPYLEREEEALDRERYQTVYAREPGAAAAPTAGLHFDEAILGQLQQKGIEVAEVTLHVGAGTFQPVRVENVEEHRMHSEYIRVGQATCDKILETRRRGGKVVATGTTTLRSLESAALQSGESGQAIAPFEGETDIFIFPGFSFRVVDALLTNFHLPESTLMMLVSAFAGRDNILGAYEEAVRERYRFFSYGDAMFLDPGIRREGGSDGV